MDRRLRSTPRLQEGLLPGPIITTGRLVLSPLSAADSTALFAYRSLQEVSRYQNWEPQSLEDAAAFIAALASTEFDTPGTWFQLGVRLRESGELIGDLGLHFLGDGQQVEIGCTLAPAFQGRGIGTEAVTGVLALLFQQLGKHRVFASADPRNRSSLRLLRRVGMRQEAHFRRSLLFKGEWADDVIFAVLDSEWVDREPADGLRPRD
jgi:RimJ/RimL family protein N-acetyltransferase